MAITIHYSKQNEMKSFYLSRLKQILIPSLVFSTFIFCLLPTSLVHAGEVKLDHIVVVVNDDVITQKMLDNRVNDFKKQLNLKAIAGAEEKALIKQVLERMIRDKIQLQKAKLLGLQIDDLLLNRMLDKLAKSNSLTLEQFRDAIESEGLSFSRFREQTRNDLIIKNLQQRLVASKITISDQEIKQYIKQNESQDASNTVYHLRHILISIPEEASPEEIQKAETTSESVFRKIQGGSKFTDMAVKYSSGRNAINGGDLGERKANELPELFIQAVKDLAPGETASPVRSASGFHILQLVSSSNNSVMVKQTHARHILLRTSNELNDDQAREKLLDIKQQIENGKKFSELAALYSEDPGSKTTGGDLGWAGPGDFVPAFENVMNNLEPGQLSEPFKSRFGWHLLEVIERRDHDQSKSNKENAARKAIQKRKIDEELRLWLRRIRDEAYVEYLDDAYKPDKK